MASQHPYLSPDLPFTGCIHGGLFEGKSITVTGRVLAGAETFYVNLQRVTSTSNDIALHFNPRYSRSSGYVVCNTLQNSCWGSEQHTNHTPLPRGSNFTLTFLVNRDSFSVIVNGAHFLEYLHRLPVGAVNTISVDGGVEIMSINFQSPCETVDQSERMAKFNQMRQSKVNHISFPNMQQETPIVACCSVAGLKTAPPSYNSLPAYVIPYKTIIQGGLYPGRAITVQGCVNHNADMFCINLRYNGGIALHFNPRFNQNRVVRNSLIKERWGREEKTGGIPFYRGQQFTVSIMCDTKCYRISVNGAQMFTYNHRHFLFQQVDILEVDGDISISSVTV